MARVSFSPLVEEIVGTFAGSVFQDSYGGYQIRTRVSPRNPQSTYQQLRRGEFGFLSSTWRNLTSTERQTFIDNASSPGAGLNLFLQANVCLTLIEEPTITTYVPGSAPTSMDIQILSATPEELTFIATGATTTVPAGTKLLFYATMLKAPTKIFTNPSQYSPIISFDAGEDLSTPHDVIAAFNTRYGQITADKLIGFKVRLIDKTNGLSGPEFITSTTTEEMAKFVRIFTNVTPVNTSGTSLTDIFNFNIPANTFTQVGDTIIAFISGHNSGSIGNATINFFFTGAASQGFQQTSNGPWQITVKVIRIDANTVECTFYGGNHVGAAIVNRNNVTSIDFTSAIATKWQIQAPISGTMTADYTYMNKELV